MDKKFDKILKSTDYEFHDASIKLLNFNFESGDLELSIKHCRFNNNTNCDYVFLSNFHFKNVFFYSVHFFRNIDSPAIDYDEIDSFELKDEIGDKYFIISGIKGWQIKFKATDFDYIEKKIDKYEY